MYCYVAHLLHEVLQQGWKHQQRQDNCGCVCRVAEWWAAVAHVTRNKSRDAARDTAVIVSLFSTAFSGIFVITCQKENLTVVCHHISPTHSWWIKTVPRITKYLKDCEKKNYMCTYPNCHQLRSRCQWSRRLQRCHLYPWSLCSTWMRPLLREKPSVNIGPSTILSSWTMSTENLSLVADKVLQ